jgi:hypothetical protein
MKKFASLAAIGLTLLAVGLVPLAPALAATQKPSTKGTGQALEIAPPIENISGNPGQTLKLTVKLRNISKTYLVVSNQVNDFVAAGEDGTPKILLKNNDNDNPYSIRQWVGPLPSFTVSPGHIKDLPVTITIPKNASPGGHYGVIRFTGTAPNLKGSGVSLSASLGMLVLLRVNGPVQEKLSIDEFSVNHGGKTGSLFESGPVNFVEKIKNSGNIHEEPTGHIVIKNMFGKTLAGLNVNLPPRNILPASTRKFSQPLDKTVIGNKKLFGKYTATLKITYASGKKTLDSKLTFWVIPYKLIAALAVLLVVIFFGLRYLLRRYNRRIIEKSRGSQGPDPQAPQGPQDSQRPQQGPPSPSSTPEPPTRPSEPPTTPEPPSEPPSTPHA